MKTITEKNRAKSTSSDISTNSKDQGKKRQEICKQNNIGHTSGALKKHKTVMGPDSNFRPKGYL